MSSPSSERRWEVHKFGGTSVLNADRYRGVSRILDAQSAQNTNPRLAVVLSAMKGVTDDLIALVHLAQMRDEGYRQKLSLLRTRHDDAVRELGISGVVATLDQQFQSLDEVLRGIWHAGSAAERIVEWVSGHGEVWSALLFAEFLKKSGRPAHFVDAREILVVDPGEKNVVVDWKKSQEKMDRFLAGVPNDACLVITGFVASTADGVATTLKRNGSDFSASIFGDLLSAREIVIWTDVDGVLSADPRLVPDAVVLDEMTYDEVSELAHFGAKVVHPATMEPAVRKNIPVWIRNTFNPTFPGTQIHSGAKSQSLVKGFSAIEKIALVNIEGSGLVGVSGIAERLFSALAARGISVVLISQASSERSICFAVSEKDAPLAQAAIEKAFYAEIHQGALDRIDVVVGKCILAAVGDNMVAHPGVAGQFFSALGRAGVNIDAIAQGSSERNISAVISSKDASRALRAVHSAFYLSKHTIGIGVIGAGLIGKEFLKQLESELGSLKERFGIDVRVRAIMNSQMMLLDGRDERGLTPGQWDSFAKDPAAQAANREVFIRHLQSGHLPHTVVIDATASDAFISLYPEWLQNGLHIITPNKKANTQSLRIYESIRQAEKIGQKRFFYSTNVGAGLPLLQTLRELVQTGDRIIRVEGVLSGTLSYIFNSFDGKKPFSEIVREARSLGYTEPDPRDDLSGTDVARKLVILAREAGGRIELTDVPVESLIPASLQKISVDDYLSRLPEGDATMEAKRSEAANRGEVLRYVGVIDETGRASVELKSFPKTHAFASLSGADNIVSFQTTRYRKRPLVIQGPGAGPEVTAAGVFADLLRLASHLGATR